MRLLEDADNGNGSPFQLRHGQNQHLDQLKTLYVWGDFDGAAVTLEISPNPDDFPWFPVTGVSITTDAAVNVEFRANFVRAVVSGGGGAESLNAIIL